MPRSERAPRPRIDPRIRERRVTVTREQGRRRLRVVVAVIAVVLVVAAGWLVVRSPLLDVDRVVVTGTQRVDAATVRAAADVEPGDALVFVDLGAVARRVERVPWIDEARVDRHLPDELAIRVTERAPALWARTTADEVALIDDEGRVLDTAPTPPELPELTGTATVPDPGAFLSPASVGRILRALPTELRRDVVRVTVTDRDVALGVSTGLEIRFGPPTAVGEKAEAALAVLRTLTPPFPTYLDVRSPSAPVTG